MALNINGTTGISGVDGSASAPALQGTDSNTGINFASDTVNINTGGVSRATVDSSGRVGIGVSDVSDYWQGGDQLVVKDTGTGGCGITIHADTDDESGIFFADGTAGNAKYEGYIQYHHSDNSMRLATSAVERMRVDSAGRGFFNRTAALTSNSAMFQVKGGISIDDNSSFRNIYMSGNGHLYFYNGVNQGFLSTSGTWTDASDENLKKDITDLTYGIDSLKNLKPRKFKMKSDDKEQIGFIAQEVESVIKEVVVTGETPDGSQQKGLAYGHLTAVLTKALQEAIAKIEVLETKVAALEAG